MKTLKVVVLYICWIFALSSNLFAQNNENSVKEISSKEQSYILTDISFISDAIFLGRKDSIAAPYLFPSIGYYDKSGFFVDASASYLTASNENRIDLFLLSGGYLFSKNKWSGGVSATGYFYNDASYAVQSALSAGLTGLINYDFKVLETSLSLGSLFGSENSVDFFTELKISRSLYTKNEKFLIIPAIALQSGSQNFYEAYYQSSRLGNRKGKGSGGQDISSSQTITIKEATEFNILNLELSLPLQYYHKSFIFSFTPMVSFPQNGATIVTEDFTIQEELDTIFYWSAGISYWIPIKNK